MGCSSSSLHTNIRGQTQAEITFLRKTLSLNDYALWTLLKAFKKINIHDNGIVAFDEFCARIRHEPIYFLESVFSFFSSSDASTSRLTVGLNFAEFVLFCCFFLTLDEHGFVEYLFLILTDGAYNRSLLNKNNTFQIHNLQENIHHCFGSAWGKTERQRQTVTWMMDHSDSLKHDGQITRAEFIRGCERNKSLIFPAVSCQIDIRAKVVGDSFWMGMQGLGNSLLKKDIKAIRDALHRIEGATQYHDNVDHFHHHRQLAEQQEDREDRDKDDGERSAELSPQKHAPIAHAGHHHHGHTAASGELHAQQRNEHEVHQPHFPPPRAHHKHGHHLDTDDINLQV